MDEKPSNFLQRLRNLAGGQCSDAVLRTLFMEQLPGNVRSILAINEVTDISKLALQADKITEMSRGSVAQINSDREPRRAAHRAKQSIMEDSSATETAVEEVRIVLDTFTKKIMRMERGSHRARSKSRNRYGPRVRAKSPRPKPRMCFYHRKFGKDAYRCLTPCTWKEGEQKN